MRRGGRRHATRASNIGAWLLYRRPRFIVLGLWPHAAEPPAVGRLIFANQIYIIKFVLLPKSYLIK